MDKLDKFNIHFDKSLKEFCPDIDIEIIDGRDVLSVANDFSDNKWQYQKFQNFIFNNIARTALSKRERDNIIDNSYGTLVESAKKLRLIDSKNELSDTEGSELAEILLYGIMHHRYKALPVVPKIFNKQNSSDNAKGADSVHIVVEEGDEFSIWYGEAKFYNSIEDPRLYEIVNSVLNIFSSSAFNTENRILSNSNDLREYLKDNLALYEKIINVLDTDSPIDYVKARLNIPILLLHVCDITKQQMVNNEEYIEGILDFQKNRVTSFYKKLYNKAIKNNSKVQPVINFDKIKFHFIFFPVPDKKSIISNFLKRAENLREEL
ncbi:HamA C-terminal domain-containing protein [Myroides odoratimimus]|uniref:Anti-bacteriophage protein A/HamA C-terminal domain-containing protein n=1 Tax=Myroides odoratimimus CIP 101113 TaxID=883154 RepID=A0AAV3F3W4_9FLAO|nr:DUF1837 domain-containing protein [Myroides odoratimimus]EHO13009.1 hypothetical protein HMPREF9715_01489 [Myroides odoratimimus CIP 101113]